MIMESTNLRIVERVIAGNDFAEIEMVVLIRLSVKEALESSSSIACTETVPGSPRDVNRLAL